ncbi:MAG: RDD family protein [Opitutaceae bacterium]|nr:RDD family protein [Opitutaceae bacterium]
MNKSRSSFLFAGWLALTLALWPVLRAQETPPPPPVPVEPAPAVTPAEPAAALAAAPAETPVAEKTDEVPPTDDKAVAPAEKPAEGELRELGADEKKPASTIKKRSTRTRSSGVRHNDPQFGDHTVSAGNTQNEAVSVFGDTTVEGHVTDAAVSVFGNTTVNGTVDDAAVSVFGTTTINGHVKGEAVAILGDVVLGPDAVVDGEVVAVLGKVVRGPGAQIHGGTQQIGSFGPFGDFTGLRVWFNKCLLMGRPLAFDSRLMWAWYAAFGLLAFYALIALIAPTGVQKCVDTLEQRPGSSLLAALLTMLLTPVAYLLLVLTLTLVIGFVLLPLFSLGLFFAAIFGKIVMLAWLGRRITKLLGDGPLAHPVFGVLIGGVIMLLLYTVPIGGFVLYKLMGILGLGVVIYTMIQVFKASRPPKPAAVAAAPVTAAVAAAPLTGDAPPPMAAVLPPVISSATLPRAGFWIRLAAVVLDAILIGMVCGFLSNMWDGFGVFPFWFAAYCAAMWATKGTTIGGIICSLKVVRLDDRPLDWGVAVVRTLGGFLSLFVAGLGFIWVAFDDEKQSWHDKIAGTTIVRVPKGVALL